MKTARPRSVFAGGILSCVLWAVQAMAATPVLPPIYRGGINLATNGGTVSRALTCWKNTIYVSVDAEDCHTGTPQSAATVFVVDGRNPTNLVYLTKSSDGGCKANGLAVYEDTLYVANRSVLLRTFDLVNAGQVRPLADFYVEGDFGWSPLYSVPTVLLDADQDNMDDDWERSWFGTLSRDGQADYDADGQSDHDEFVAATNPKAHADCFKVLEIARTANRNLRLDWSAVPGKAYRVQVKPSLASPTWTDVPGSNLVATNTVATWAGTTGPVQGYYRVVVQRP